MRQQEGGRVNLDIDIDSASIRDGYISSFTSILDVYETHVHYAILMMIGQSQNNIDDLFKWRKGGIVIGQGTDERLVWEH